MVSVKIHKPSISFYKSNKIYEKEKIIYNNLISKYSKFEYSYSLLSINNLIFNEHCLVVARFKDFLILDDMTEFLRRFYNKKELKRRLNKIFNFYESYSKIFPNYMILPESQYLYRNIRKKQKMIDAFNQIKKEEEENRNSLKKELNNKEKKEIMIFNKSIQESINRYRPSETSILFNSIISGFIKSNNNYNDSNWNSLISISLNKVYPSNSTKNNYNNNNIKSGINSFDCENKEITLNSENSLINIVQILNQKYKSNNNSNNNTNSLNKLYNNNSKNKNNNLNNSKNKNNHKIIYSKNDKSKKMKNKNIKETKIKTIKKINHTNTKVEIDKVKIKENNNSNPKKSSPDQNQIVKTHIHQKSTLNNNNNNNKFISHKQAVSVSNNNNTIKIINNINNIIINDANINKEMVININTNYFELNNANLNAINTINKITDNNENIHKNINNALIKKAKKIKSKTKSKETSLSNKKDNNYYTKKLNTNFKANNNFIGNRIEEKRINTYSNHILNNINYDNNIINNNVIIHNNTASNTNKTKNIQNKIRNQINENKNIKGIYEYKALNINNIGNSGNLYSSKNKKNYIQKEINKKAVTIEVEPNEKNKKSQSKKKDLIGKGNKKTSCKPIFSTKTHKKGTLEILNTDGNINYEISHFNNSNTYNHNYTEHIPSNNLNNKNILLKNNDKIEHLKTKLNKKIMSRKQKTNSFQIKNKNNFFFSFNNYKQIKESNPLKRNNISNNDNFINYYIKNNTQSLDLDNIKTKKNINSIEKNDIKENKFKKISAKEMKEKYHKFMQGNKIIHGSYDTSNRLHLFKKFSSLYNSHNKNNNNNNITEISQRKILDIKSPFKINNLHTSPGSKVSNDKTPNGKKIHNLFF